MFGSATLRSSSRSGWLVWILILGLVGWSASSWTTRAWAQEATEDGAPAEGGDAKAKAEGGGDGEVVEEKNFLWWLIETSGWIGAVILVISIYFVRVVTLAFLNFKLDLCAPPDLIDQVEGAVKKRDVAGAYALVKQDETFYGNVVRVGIAGLPYGLSHVRDSMDRTGETQVVDMERQISMLAVIGSLGPLIGLLGTLKGMISSFSAIAISGTQLKANEVAMGISEALLLTFEGVMLSVPAIYFYAVFKNRVSSISSHVMEIADDQVLRLHAMQQQAKVTRPGTDAAPKT